MSHTQAEADALRDKVLNTMRDTYDHVRTTAATPGDPESRVRVLARRRDNHLIEEEL
jgi:hypothetical protein